METIFEKITEFINTFLISLIEKSLGGMFDDVNTKVGTIATEVGKTPWDWNSGVFSIIKSLSENVILPIAGLIITFVLCYELITMITEKNNMHDIDTFMFFKFIFKACVAIIIATHAFDIIMGVFDLGQYVVQRSAAVINADAGIDISSALTDIKTTLESMETSELLLLALETMLISISMKLMSILITIIIFGRMIEIYIYSSVGAIPFATMTNREWGQMGNNYLRGLVALAMQGFFIMVCVAIYAALVNGFTVTEDIQSTVLSVAAYTVVLCFTLFKTSSISKSIFNAH